MGQRSATRRVKSDAIGQSGVGVGYAASSEAECAQYDTYLPDQRACMRVLLPQAYKNSRPRHGFKISDNPYGPNIYYDQIGFACPYGGDRVNETECQVAYLIGLTINVAINPNHNFWIDDNQNWPGLYSKKVLDACPYTGIPDELGCTIARLPALRPGVHWWIDASVNTKGIYYGVSDGNCHLGGIYLVNGCRLYDFVHAFPTIGRGFHNLPNVNFETFVWGGQLALSYQTTNNARVCLYGGTKVGNKCVIHTWPDVDVNHEVWIDRHPGWPGVYYRPVNQQCIYGGIYGGDHCQIYRFTQPQPGYIPPVVPEIPEEECGKPGVCRRN